MLIEYASEYDGGAESSEWDMLSAPSAQANSGSWAGGSNGTAATDVLVSQLRHAAREGLIFRALTILQKLIKLRGYAGVSAIDEADENGQSAMTFAAARGHAPILHGFLVKSSEEEYSIRCMASALVRSFHPIRKNSR
jgi:hypothetical protein